MGISEIGQTPPRQGYNPLGPLGVEGRVRDKDLLGEWIGSSGFEGTMRPRLEPVPKLPAAPHNPYVPEPAMPVIRNRGWEAHAAPPPVTTGPSAMTGTAFPALIDILSPKAKTPFVSGLGFNKEDSEPANTPRTPRLDLVEVQPRAYTPGVPECRTVHLQRRRPNNPLDQQPWCLCLLHQYRDTR